MITVNFFIVLISLMAPLLPISLADDSSAKPAEAFPSSIHQVVDQSSSSSSSSSPPCSTSGDPPDGQPNIESSFSDHDTAPIMPNEPPPSTTNTFSTTTSAGAAWRYNHHQTSTSNSMATNSEITPAPPITQYINFRDTSSSSQFSSSSTSLCLSNSNTGQSLPNPSTVLLQNSAEVIIYSSPLGQLPHHSIGIERQSQTQIDNAQPSSSTPFNSNSNSNAMQPPPNIMHDHPMPSHHAIDIGPPANQPFPLTTNIYNRPVMLGKTFLALTSEAALGLMVFRFQGPSSSSPDSSLPSSSSSSPSSVHARTLEIVEVAMTVGLTCTLIGILLRHAYLRVANYIEYAGVFAASLGFFGITTIFLPDNVNWIVWPAGLLLLAAFILALFKMRSSNFF